MPITPVVCLHLHHASYEMPLIIRHQFLYVKLKTQLLLLSDHPVLSLINKDCWQVRFPDSSGFCSFDTVCSQRLRLFTSFSLPLPYASQYSSMTCAETCIRPPLTFHPPDCVCAFIAPVFFLQAGDLYYQLVKTYTNGSKTSARVGCGVHIADRNFRHSILMNKFSTSFPNCLPCSRLGPAPHLLVKTS